MGKSFSFRYGKNALVDFMGVVNIDPGIRKIACDILIVRKKIGVYFLFATPLKENSGIPPNLLYELTR